MVEITADLMSEILIKSHQTGYFRVELTDDGELETHDDIDVNDRRPDNHLLLSVGTGSVACNCDACQAGDSPEDWAYDDTEAAMAYEEHLHDAIREVQDLRRVGL